MSIGNRGIVGRQAKFVETISDPYAGGDRAITIVGEVCWFGSAPGNGRDIQGNGFHAVIVEPTGRLHVRSIGLFHLIPETCSDDGSFEYAEAEMLRWSDVAKARKPR